MKERLSRLQAIKKIIKTSRISSHESLLEKLQEEGFPVTLTTLSRDLKLLKVGRIPDNNGTYTYILPNEETTQTAAYSFSQDFARGCAGIACSGNMLVIKTYSGYSDIVAHALDKMNFDEILGTISGRDNCVFACLKEGVHGKKFISVLKGKIPDLDI